MKPERARLIEDIVDAMKGVPKRIEQLQVGHFAKADREYGRSVAKGLGLS